MGFSVPKQFFPVLCLQWEAEAPIRKRDAMEELICHPDEGREYFTEGRCFILESWNDPRDAHVSIARARAEPGVTTRRHRLSGVTERHLILVGRGRVEIGDLPPGDVLPGDVAVIPPGTRQRITNSGRDDRLFFCVCIPRFVPEAYEDTDN